jgi:hypothetical protein
MAAGTGFEDRFGKGKPTVSPRSNPKGLRGLWGNPTDERASATAPEAISPTVRDPGVEDPLFCGGTKTRERGGRIARTRSSDCAKLRLRTERFAEERIIPQPVGRETTLPGGGQ